MSVGQCPPSGTIQGAGRNHPLTPPLGRAAVRVAPALARVLLAGRTALASAGALPHGALFLDRGEPHLLLCAMSALACRRVAAQPAR